MLCVALFACAFNLLIGYVGLLSFGHAMFFGMASYVSRARREGLGARSRAGDPLRRRRGGGDGPASPARWRSAAKGIYFAMITVALSQMVYFFCVEAPFTHGEDGIQSVPQRPRARPVRSQRQHDALRVRRRSCSCSASCIVYRTVNSPFGEVLKAIRENEPRAVSLGYRVVRYKLMAFMLSAALAGLAGATKAHRRAERLAQRRAIRHVGRSGADDAARRHGHALRPRRRRAWSSWRCRTISPNSASG